MDFFEAPAPQLHNVDDHCHIGMPVIPMRRQRPVRPRKARRTTYSASKTGSVGEQQREWKEEQVCVVHATIECTLFNKFTG